METKTIRISIKTKKILDALSIATGETYEGIILRLIKYHNITAAILQASKFKALTS